MPLIIFFLNIPIFLFSAPGEPRELEITATTSHTITIEYDEPENNPQCAVHYNLDIAKKGNQAKLFPCLEL